MSKASSLRSTISEPTIPRFWNLRRLPFSELKIDRAFVRNMETSEEAEIIVNAVIGLGRALRLELVAEGVETAEVAKRLAAAGCQIAQGYYFGKPMPPESIAAWCAANSQYLQLDFPAAPIVLNVRTDPLQTEIT